MSHKHAKTAFQAALGLFVIITAAACGTHPAMATAPASAVAAATATHSAAATALSCKQQYKAWKNGATKPVGKKLTTELTAVQAAGGSEDIPALLAALKAVGKTAADLERYPAPACADPHGYWKKIPARIKAAGDNAGADSGLTGLLLAEAPLKADPALEKSWTRSSNALPDLLKSACQRKTGAGQRGSGAACPPRSTPGSLPAA